jgi:hypothetical protein
MADQGDTTSQQQQWQQLKQQAESGQLRMEDGIGEALFRRCETLIDAFESMRDRASRLGHTSGFGGLPSALALQKKFEQKATGGGADPDDNAVARLQAHIDVVRLMSDTYRLATAKLREQDEANARRLAGLT